MRRGTFVFFITLIILTLVFSCDNHKSRVPVYLKDYSAEYLNNPRKANLHWFTDALIRSLSPHALISFKQGANGDEDFSAPERNASATVGNQFEVAPYGLREE